MSQILARFTGISQIKYARGTRTLGPFPDAALIYFIPQNVTILDGTLSFICGDTVEWPNAHIDRVSQRRTTSGGMVGSAVILDRRVWWQYAVVDGVYNERGDDGEVIEATEKSPRELASLLLEAGGETSFDVSAMPADATDRPYVNWIGANPFYELQKLCEERGCAICYGLDDTVSIVRLGVGNPLPVGGRRDISISVDVAESPAVVRAYCGPTIVQSKWRMEAISPDETGEVRLVSDIMTDWGWEIDSPEDFFPEEESPERRRIAKQYFFRLWRIKEQAHEEGSFDPYGYDGPSLPDIEHVLPLFNGQAEVYDGPASMLANPPRVEGVYLPESRVHGEGCDANTEEGTAIDCHFTLHTRSGIVRTSRAMLKFSDDSASYEGAELVLQVSHPITNPDTHQHLRYTVEKARSTGVGTYALRLDELQRRIIVQYGDAPLGAYTAESFSDNKDSLDLQIDAAISALETKWDTQQSAAAEYQGIRNITVDGACRQVTWRVSTKKGEGANTWASLNVENDPYTMTERYRARLARELAQAQDRPWRQRYRVRPAHQVEG